MRDAFREWYEPSDDDLGALWERAIVVLDSNVLLGLYRYPPDVLADVLRALRHLRDQLWIPHQVGLEFHRNRADRLPEQRTVLERLVRELDEVVASVDRLAVPEYHPILDLAEADARRTAARSAVEHVIDLVRDAADATQASPADDAIARDIILTQVSDLFDERVGPAFSPADMADAEREADKRFQRSVPPGYKDAQKEFTRRYNDYFIWKQLLASLETLEPRRPCIFVTNDRKEDWWRRRRDMLSGPRTELIREYFDSTGEAFWMYTPEAFLEHARRFRLGDVATATIDAVRTASETSTVAGVLRSQRMVLPDVGVRLTALHRIYDDIASSRLLVVNDLNHAIRGLGDQFGSTLVVSPLFFGLINETYGPVRTVPERNTRLRDLQIGAVAGSESAEEFVALGHRAWLAQAMYRLRLEDFSEDELLTGLFRPRSGRLGSPSAPPGAGRCRSRRGLSRSRSRGVVHPHAYSLHDRGGQGVPRPAGVLLLDDSSALATAVLLVDPALSPGRRKAELPSRRPIGAHGQRRSRDVTGRSLPRDWFGDVSARARSSRRGGDDHAWYAGSRGRSRRSRR